MYLLVTLTVSSRYSCYFLYRSSFTYTLSLPPSSILFFFNDTATTEIYTLSLHDALPISLVLRIHAETLRRLPERHDQVGPDRSEEHTSELQSLAYLVCRLLLEKKKKKQRREEQTAKI